MKGAAQIRPAPARGRDGYGVRAAVAVLAALALPYAEARAACPQELAVYSEREGSAGIDFRPALPGAAAQLLLPGFGAAVRHSRIFGADGVSVLPWDVFALSGCQE